MYHFNPIFRGLLSAFLLFAGTGLYAQDADVTTVSAVSSGPIVAPDSLASAWGMDLSAETEAAAGLPLPMMLGGVEVHVGDSAGEQETAGLYLVSPQQINLLIPEGSALGLGEVTIAGSGDARVGDLFVSNVAPALISVNAMGTGMAAGQAVNVSGSDRTVDETLGAVNVGAADTDV